MNKKIIVFLSILAVVLVAGGFWYTKNKEQRVANNQKIEENKNENQTENIKEDKQDTATKDIEDKKAKFTNFLETNRTKESIKDIFENTASYNQKIGNVYFYQKNIEFRELTNSPWMNLNVVSYKYKKGGSFQNGYEGLKWTVELDKEVNSFLSLKEGIQIADMLGTLGDEKVPVELKEIGTKNYAIYNTFFKPAGNWTRHYMTFDSKNSRVIFITFSFTYYDEQKDHETTYSFDKNKGYFEGIVYPKEIDEYLKIIESSIENS
jgi:hypothetical protein